MTKKIAQIAVGILVVMFYILRPFIVLGLAGLLMAGFYWLLISYLNWL